MYPGQNKFKRFKKNQNKKINVSNVVKKILFVKILIFKLIWWLRIFLINVWENIKKIKNSD